jgi:RHS repeat-associated protein
MKTGLHSPKRLAAFTILGVLHAAAAFAELPSVKLQTSALVTPSAAWSYFGSATTHTMGVAATGTTAPEIVELANALSQGGASGSCTQGCYAQMVYQYVRNNIAMEFRFGLGKGGRGALVDQSGTPFDQAQLMVALLRQGGVAASYQLGTITLNAAQFQQWTGMSNAPGACQFLADGGIPATVNGATSCSALSAGSTVSSVVMGHIWVSALGNLYDPSYKIHVVKPGIGGSALASALGCATNSCASGVLSHVPAPVASPIAGVNQIQNVDQTGLEAQLTTYAISLQNYIKQQNSNNYLTSDPNMQVEDLLGGALIDISQPLPSPSSTTFSQLSASAYSPNSSYSWAGEIPDQFRTTLTVQFGPSGNLSINQLLYADETAGNRLRLVNSTGPGAQSDLYSEYMLLAAGPLPSVSTPTIPLVLSVTHPYPTSGYLAESLTYNVNAYGVVGQTAYTNQVTVIQGWGNASESTVAHFSALVQRDQTHTPVETLSPQNPTLTSSNQLWLIPAPQGSCAKYTPPTTPGSTSNCFELHQATYAANWLAQSSRAVALAAAVNGTIAQLHHSLGIVVSGMVPPPAPSGSGASPTLVISVQTTMSININTSAGAASDRTGAFFGATATLSRLEGSVVEQAGDSWEGGSSLSMLVKSVAASTSTHSSIPIYDVTPQNVAATVGNSNLSTYGSFYTTEIKPYVDAGGEVILPQQATAGSFCYNSVCYSPGFNGFVSYGANADRVTYGTDADGFDKGAGGESNPTGIVTQQTTIQDYSAKKRTFLTVEPSSGSVTLTPPPDLVTGAGAFPLSLAFQRVYSSAAIAYECGSPTVPYGPCMRTSAEISGLPMGWTHTFAITARLTNDGFASLGRNSALDASSVIAALFTARQLNTAARTFQSNVATIFTINWLGGKLTGNVVAVKRPPDSAAFVRLPDGSFNPPPGDSETLTQTGVRSFHPAGPSLAYWDNSQLAFALQTQRGDTLQFQYASYEDIANIYIPALYHATSWTFPSGIALSFGYDTRSNGLENAGCLTGVSSSIGRSLSFTDMCPINQNVDPPPTPPSTLMVSDDAGRTVSVSLLPSSLSGSNVCDSGCIPYMASDLLSVTGLLVQAPDGVATSEYDYVPVPTVAINRPYYQVYRWLTPGDRTNAYQTVSFDSLYRANSVKDNTSGTCCSTQYWLSGLYSTENQKLENVVDPIGAVTTKYLDRWGNLLQSIDPLKRVTSYLYDTGRRRIQMTLPEWNGFSYNYDVRSNLLSTTRHPVPGSALALAGTTTTTSTTYMEGPTVFPCVSTNTCNKALYEYDANNNQTTYAWNTNGTLSSITYPTVVDAGTTVGTPVTSYGYTTYGLVNLKTQRVWQNPSVVNLVTQYNYNTSNKYTLSSVVEDYGGKNLTTLYVFDNGGTGPGNVTQITDPNGNATGYKFDALRRLTEVDAPLSATTVYRYDLDGQLTSTQKYDSTRSAYQTEVKYYWPTGDLAYVVHPDAGPTAPAQGASTTVTSLSCPSSYVTCYSYDADGRVLTTSEPLTATTSRVSANAYDLAGQRLCSWRGFGTTASAVSQVTGSTPCAWTPSSYTSTAALRYDLLAYSPSGKITQSTDSDGNLTSLNYDGFDRLSQMILPGTTLGTAAPCHTTYTAGDDCEQYGYDNNDNRKTKTNRSGNTITYSFDAMNHEYQRQVPANVNGHFSRTLTETYDLLGRKYLATADSQTLTFNFDSAGRLGSVVDSILGTVGYGYDAASNRTQITWPDGYYATYAYDALNRVCKVKENAATTCAASDPISSLVAQYTWDTLSRRQSLAFGNSVTTGWNYFSDSALSSLTHTIGSKSVALRYTRNQVNQLTTQMVAITDPTWVLTPESFLWQPGSASNTAYAPNNLNQYATVGGVTNGFDLNGNLTSDGTYTYEYDEENRLRSATGAGNTITYDYDPLGRRRAKTVNGTMTRFLSDDQEEIGEYTSTPSLLRRYLNGPSIDEHLVQIEAAGTHYYFQTNHQGTTLLTSDTSSTPVLTSFRYGAYGDSNSPTTGAAFRYTGRRLDPETGLYYYRARYYSPTLGRFLQTDPIGSRDDINLYAYVGNDPLDRADPAGTEAATADWLRQTNALNAATPVNGEELQSFVLDSLPVVGEYRAVSDFVDHPTWLGAAVIGLSVVDGGGLLKSEVRSQRAAAREAKRQVGIPTSQQAVRQTNGAVDGVKVGRQQTFEVPKPGGGTEEKSVQVSRDLEGAHADQPQIEAGTVKPGGQTDPAGRPRIQNETKVRVPFCPDPTKCP